MRFRLSYIRSACVQRKVVSPSLSCGREHQQNMYIRFASPIRCSPPPLISPPLPALSRKGSVVNGQTTRANNKLVHPVPAPPRHLSLYNSSIKKRLSRAWRCTPTKHTSPRDREALPRSSSCGTRRAMLPRRRPGCSWGKTRKASRR